MVRYPISICMAGAVSAGTYSAGAMSVLVEALRLWESDEVDEKLLPKHRILIKGMTGASAGSVQAALSSLDIFAQSHNQNLGFDAWTSITFDSLFTTPDSEDKTVQSVLNTDALRSVTDKMRDKHQWGDQWPDFIDSGYELRLSITNLRGVPYNLELPDNNGTEFGMSRHNEYLRYSFGKKGDVRSDKELHYFIEVGDRGKSDLGHLTKGALASSAFPLAFEPVQIDRKTLGTEDVHDRKKWLATSAAMKSGEQVEVTYKETSIKPAWKPKFGPKEIVYAVDGGVTNNEPLLEAFKLLRGDEISDWGNLDLQKDSEEPYYGRVLMIDPFPNSLDMKVNEDTLRIDKQLGVLKSAMIRNGRFSEPIMVSQQLKNRVGLVYPSNPLRNPKGNSERKNPDDIVLPLKSGSLGGFAGFLKEDFLKHDYELGRINMLRFLRYHFTVSTSHELVKSDKSYIKLWKTKNQEGEEVVPIIPIYTKDENGYSIFEAQGDDRIALYRNSLDEFADTFDIDDRKKLKANLKKRFGVMGRKLIGDHAANTKPRYEKGVIGAKESWVNRSWLVKWISGKAVNTGWSLAGKGFLSNTILETIENSLAKQGLLDYRIFDSKGKHIGIDAATDLEEEVSR